LSHGHDFDLQRDSGVGSASDDPLLLPGKGLLETGDSGVGGHSAFAPAFHDQIK
jgi:hypothetical protein